MCFEYNVKNMTFSDVQRGDVIQVFWPRDTNIERRYSLAYSRNNSNVMLLIQIQRHTEIATTAPISGDNHDLFTTSKRTLACTSGGGINAMEIVTPSVIIAWCW